MEARILSYGIMHRNSELMSEVTAGYLLIRAVSMDLYYRAYNSSRLLYGYTELDFALVNLYAETEDKGEVNVYGLKDLGHGYMDHRVHTNQQKRKAPTKECRAVWIMKQVSEPTLNPESLKFPQRVEYPQTLYCLLIEVENR